MRGALARQGVAESDIRAGGRALLPLRLGPVLDRAGEVQRRSSGDRARGRALGGRAQGLDGGKRQSGTEVGPNPDPGLAFPVHQELIMKNGIFNIENLALDELARDGPGSSSSSSPRSASRARRARPAGRSRSAEESVVSKARSAMETLSAPYLLLATPTLLDPNFVQSVVLMGHHDTEGAMGWIVNRLHEKPVRELLAPGQQRGVHAETPLHLGGPVPADALLAVFHRADRRRRERRDRAGPVRLEVGAGPAAALLAGARPRARAGPAGVRVLRLERRPARARDGGGGLAGPALRRGAGLLRAHRRPLAALVRAARPQPGAAHAAAPAASTDDDSGSSGAAGSVDEVSALLRP